jgi:hypothetical protein
MRVERLDLEILVNGEQALSDPGYNTGLYEFARLKPFTPWGRLTKNISINNFCLRFAFIVI